MSYTLLCPDLDCKTTFELSQNEFDVIYETEDPIECPACCQEFEWDYDPAKADGQEITLIVPAEFEEGEDDDDEIEGDEHQ